MALYDLWYCGNCLHRTTNKLIQFDPQIQLSVINYICAIN